MYTFFIKNNYSSNSYTKKPEMSFVTYKFNQAANLNLPFELKYLANFQVILYVHTTKKYLEEKTIPEEPGQQHRQA